MKIPSQQLRISLINGRCETSGNVCLILSVDKACKFVTWGSARHDFVYRTAVGEDIQSVRLLSLLIFGSSTIHNRNSVLRHRCCNLRSRSSSDNRTLLRSYCGIEHRHGLFPYHSSLQRPSTSEASDATVSGLCRFVDMLSEGPVRVRGLQNHLL